MTVSPASAVKKALLATPLLAIAASTTYSGFWIMPRSLVSSWLAWCVRYQQNCFPSDMVELPKPTDEPMFVAAQVGGAVLGAYLAYRMTGAALWSSLRPREETGDEPPVDQKRLAAHVLLSTPFVGTFAYLGCLTGGSMLVSMKQAMCMRYFDDNCPSYNADVPASPWTEDGYKVACLIGVLLGAWAGYQLVKPCLPSIRRREDDAPVSPGEYGPLAEGPHINLVGP